MANKRSFFILYILLFTCLITNGQEATVDTSDLIIYKAPSKNYKTFYLQSYKGLPRFGIMDNYTKPKVNKTVTTIPRESKEKLRLTQLGLSNYDKLIRLKYNLILNKDIIGNITTLGSDEIVLKYLCNPKNPYCKGCTQEALNENWGIIGSGWGGHNANEFEQKRSSAAFLKEGLDKELKKWSSSFFANHSEIVYNVSRVRIKNYDFDKGGYPVYIALGTSQRSHRPPYIVNFVPVASYEKELLEKPNATSFTTFLKLSQEKAEELTLKKISSLYLVSKVKIIYKEATGNKKTKFTPRSFKYHYESPTIEFFEDIGLTQKIGEISLDKI